MLEKIEAGEMLRLVLQQRLKVSLGILRAGWGAWKESMACFSKASLCDIINSGRTDAEDLPRELRIEFGDLRRYRLAQERQRVGRGRWRLRHV